jgi:hypothetical protein
MTILLFLGLIMIHHATQYSIHPIIKQHTSLKKKHLVNLTLKRIVSHELGNQKPLLLHQSHIINKNTIKNCLTLHYYLGTSKTLITTHNVEYYSPHDTDSGFSPILAMLAHHESNFKLILIEKNKKQKINNSQTYQKCTK